MLKNLKSSGWIIGLIAIAVVLFLLFSGRGGGSNIPATGPGQAQQDTGLGRIFTATELTNDGCPANQATEFQPRDDIFVGLQRSDIPRGTSVFARLYQEGRVLEDAEEVVADRNMNNTCIWFSFSPRGGWEPGNYNAEIIINGNPVDRVGFTVDDRNGGLFGGGGRDDGGVQLGQVVTTTQVDNAGCPVDSVDQFYPDEDIYVSADESIIPAGTEVFARLVYEGRIVEDTDPIRADRDLQSCVWFAFEPSRGSDGFQPGDYEAEIYVNGSLAETVPFEVR